MVKDDGSRSHCRDLQKRWSGTKLTLSLKITIYKDFSRSLTISGVEVQEEYANALSHLVTPRDGWERNYQTFFGTISAPL
jgi:hypothetical protein